MGAQHPLLALGGPSLGPPGTRKPVLAVAPAAGRPLRCWPTLALSLNSLPVPSLTHGFRLSFCSHDFPGTRERLQTRGKTHATMRRTSPRSPFPGVDLNPGLVCATHSGMRRSWLPMCQEGRPLPAFLGVWPGKGTPVWDRGSGLQEERGSGEADA